MDPAGYLVEVSCEECGFEHLVEQMRGAGQRFYMVCHRCEAVLAVRMPSPEAAEQRVPALVVA